jgi:hypothetical protein
VRLSPSQLLHRVLQAAQLFPGTLFPQQTQRSIGKLRRLVDLLTPLLQEYEPQKEIRETIREGQQVVGGAAALQRRYSAATGADTAPLQRRYSAAPHNTASSAYPY